MRPLRSVGKVINTLKLALVIRVPGSTAVFFLKESSEFALYQVPVLVVNSVIRYLVDEETRLNTLIP